MKKLIIFEEPDDTEQLNMNLVKQLTGGDQIIVRPFYCFIRTDSPGKNG